MRTRRIKEAGEGYYHVVSRIVDRRMVLNDHEKERFRQLIRQVEGFSGCSVLAYSVLSNHFHALLHVPERRELTDAEFLARLEHLYDRSHVADMAIRLKTARETGTIDEANAIRAPYLRRMFDLSECIKDIKQRASQNYNRRHDRRGTLWEERFKSVLVEGNTGTLSRIAAYIDLNAVRAGIVDDPKDYRFCSYGEAMGGSLHARHGIRRVMSSVDRNPHWGQAASEYRQLLYAAGASRGLDELGRPKRRGFTEQQVRSVQKAEGELPVGTLLRCRVRYFTDGAILGTWAFVNDAFQRHRDNFGAKRRTAAHCVVGAWGDLCSARRLRLDVLTPPATG